jgi:hypothetical protein
VPFRLKAALFQIANSRSHDENSRLVQPLAATQNSDFKLQIPNSRRRDENDCRTGKSSCAAKEFTIREIPAPRANPARFLDSFRQGR